MRKRDKFNHVVKFRCPPWLTAAIVKVAQKSGLSVSDFMRETAIEKIETIDPDFVATRKSLTDSCKS